MQRLDDVCILITDGTHYSPKNEGVGLPFVTVKDMSEVGLDFDNCIRISEEVWQKADDGNSAPRSGDVLLSKDGTVGKVHVVKNEAKFAALSSIAILRPNPEILDSDYLGHFLKSEEAMRQASRMKTGTALRRIILKDIKKIQLRIPSLKEQRRIAAILDKASLIKKDKDIAIEKRSELLKSLFYHMFGDPITNPKGWSKKPLGELVTIVRGGSPRPIKDYLGGSIPWIKIGDATKGDEVYLHQTKENITEAGLTKTRLLEKGSLIFANCGVSLGFARIITFRGCIHDGWLAFSDIEEDIVDKMFLLKALNCVTMYFRDTAPDGTQPNLNTSIMKKFEIILPPIKLQKEFSEYCHKEYKNSNYDLNRVEQLIGSLSQKITV